ncbi:hypothetical protein SEA_LEEROYJENKINS_57 [Microbacterium phage LeeroyJenkins]|nr:hypothetical protein SEA_LEEROYJENKINS_57 [Microbacterium phage LeeroyJenkins]
MTRYNSEANEPYVGMKEEHIPIEQLDGYREGVDRVLWYIREIKADSRLLEELGFAIKDGVI